MEKNEKKITGVYTGLVAEWEIDLFLATSDSLLITTYLTGSFVSLKNLEYRINLLF